MEMKIEDVQECSVRSEEKTFPRIVEDEEKFRTNILTFTFRIGTPRGLRYFNMLLV